MSNRRTPRSTVIGWLLDRDLGFVSWVVVRTLANPLYEITRQSKAGPS